MPTKTHKLIQLTLACALITGVRTSALEIPRRADDFLDSIGVNIHIDDTVYHESMVAQSGIRHLRSNTQPTKQPLQEARLESLFANHGLRVNLVCDSTSFTPVQYRDLMKHAMFASIEGLNEPDVVGPRSYQGHVDNWSTQTYPATLAYQQALFNAMQADPITASKAVLSPAMANPAHSRYLRSVAADLIAMHSYPNQEMPTGNFLSSFAIPAALMMADPNAPTMRVIATETGYKFGPAAGDISNAAAAKYVPRLFAEYFRLGVARTFLFEMLDAPGVYNFGLLDGSWNPKPAYGVLKNLTKLLKDSVWDASQKAWVAPAFNPAMIDYTITGGTSNVHHVLLQKSNGKVYLLLWQEVPSYDLVALRDIANPTVPVDVTFNLPLTAGSLYQLDSASPKATYDNVTTVRINVPDEVVVLEFTPGQPVIVAPKLPDASPVVSIAAISARAVASTHELGKVSVTRSGSTATAMTVSYSVSGSAASGIDYDAVSGSVSIPAGATEAIITVSPRATSRLGRKNVVLTLNPHASYDLSNPTSATVYVGDSRTVMADLETGISGWSSNHGTATSWDLTNADTGIGAIKAVLNISPANRWGTDFQLNFSTPQDWSTVSTIELRIKESASNPITNIGKPLYFTWHNRGLGANGAAAVGKIPLSHSSDYQTVTLDLHDFPRDSVTALVFVVDGLTLETGKHNLYIDNIVAVTGTNTVLEDFEQSGSANWNSGGQSALRSDNLNVDTGGQGMKWTYTDSPAAMWDNHIKLNFSQPVDLGKYSTLCLRFKEDPANPTTDIGERIFFDFYNNGTRANNDMCVASFSLKAAGGYRTVELNLADFRRDKVNSLFFYVNGASFKTGQHVWYLDNVTVY